MDIPLTVKEMNERKLALGYSYEQIASLSKVPESTVRKVLGGITRAPRHETLLALSKAFIPSDRDRAPVSYAQKETPPQIVAEAAGAPLAWKRQGEYTLKDYLAIPDDRRVELIDGVIYDMSTPAGYHQLIAGRLYAMLLDWISSRKGGCMPFISPVDVQLDCDDRTIVQPDLLILCDRSRYTPARIVGAPDFAAEVLSPSSRTKDIFIKLNKYRSAGVREYWIIDPDAKTVMVWHFEKDDAVTMYGFRDQIPVGIYDGELVIDFFVIDDYVTPWM